MRAFVALKRRAQVQYGLGQPPQLANEGVAIIRATNIFRGRIIADGLIRTRLEDLPLDRAPLLKAGEVLVVRSGAYTGDSALVTSEWAGSAPGYDLRITPGHDLEPRFLAYTMLGRRAMDEIDLAKSRAAQPHLNAEDLGQVGVLDVSISTQRIIAGYLDREVARIDALIVARRRMVQLLQEREEEWLRLLIDRAGGERRPLRWFMLIGSGDALPAAEIGIDGVTPVYGGNGIMGYTSRPPMTKGPCIVIGRVGALCGNVHIVPGSAWITDNALWIRDTRDLDVDYLGLVLRIARLNALADKTAQPLITGETVKKTRVPFLALADQEKLEQEAARSSSGTRAMLDLLEDQVALLQERRQGLISAAVTGQLDIPETA